MESSKEEKKLGRLSDIGLWIEDYDYIFSDFDSRPYSQKLISEDLLSEMNRASKEKKTGGIEIKFLVPKNKRDFRKESIIKKRLKEHFKHTLQNLEDTKRKLLKEGALFVFFGIIFMFVATFFLTKGTSDFFLTFLSVLSEPAGWFLFWEGLNLIIFDSKKKVPDLDFYRKMSKAQIIFVDFD